MKIFHVLTCCCAALLLSGCISGKEEKTPVTKLQKGVEISEAEIAKIGEAYFRQAVTAMETGDHAKFTEHYVDEYKKTITPEVFNRMSASYRLSHGKMTQLKYLGCINKYSGRILLWSAIFERTPAVNEQLKKAGQDPTKIPQTESLVQMMIGKTDKGWKIIRMGIQ